MKQIYDYVPDITSFAVSTCLFVSGTCCVVSLRFSCSRCLLYSKSQAFMFQVHVVADVRGHGGSAAADERGDSAEEQLRSRGKLRLARRSTLRTVKIKTCK